MRKYSFGTMTLFIGFVYTLFIMIAGNGHQYYHLLLGIGFAILAIGFLISGREARKARMLAKQRVEQAKAQRQRREEVAAHGKPAPRKKGRSK